MRMDGRYHIVLKAGVNEGEFVRHLHRQFSNTQFFTRITRAVDTRLLKAETGRFAPHYVLQMSVDLVVDRPYSFDEHVPELSAVIEAFGVVTGLDVFTVVTSEPESVG